jgi:hypothetical protein
MVKSLQEPLSYCVGITPWCIRERERTLLPNHALARDAPGLHVRQQREADQRDNHEARHQHDHRSWLGQLLPIASLFRSISG